MIKRGIPIYIKPSERLCDYCKHSDLSIKESPCIQCCGPNTIMPTMSHWEISPERKVNVEFTSQRIEQLEFMVLEIQNKVEELDNVLVNMIK